MQSYRHPFSMASFGVSLTMLFAIHSILGDEPKKNQIDFNNQIRPILSQHCVSCHGPDEEDRQADFRVDTFEGATADLGGYAGLVPFEPDQSELLNRVTSEDEYLRMPPPEHSDGLNDDEVNVLRRWIESGGNYDVHWSFQPIRKPSIPSRKVDAKDVRVFNPIDAFVTDSLENSGLEQNPPAEPERLIRRVCLDLTGLPPASQQPQVLEAIDLFLNETTQEHFTAVVEKLLQTDAYAEHWASMWLDIARYADTVGYAGDENRTIWPWRDWLIQRLASDMSYRDMSIEMIAGDLLPDATPDQVLGTAFHRNTLSNNEGGTSDEEFRTIAVKDRLSTTLNTWMGLTVRCAECHSHKYDPISQHEYYALLDFFNQTEDADRPNEHPVLPVTPANIRRNRDSLLEEIARLENEQKSQPSAWKVRIPSRVESEVGNSFRIEETGLVVAIGDAAATDTYEISLPINEDEVVTGLRLEVLPSEENGGRVGRHSNGSFIISRVNAALGDGQKTVPLRLSDAAADYSQSGHDVQSVLESGKIDPGRGWAVHRGNDGFRVPHEAIFEFAEPIRATAKTTLKISLIQESKWSQALLGAVRVSVTETEKPASKYRSGEIDPIGAQIASLKSELDTKVSVPIAKELDSERRRVTHVMLRGSYLSPTDPVAAAFPEQFAMFAPSKRVEQEHFDRLDLANWIFADENPLTARVAVNRYWARLFGIGIVETEEDFGTQGSLPSHPDLLDWLATDFQEHGWDTRHLLRQIATSATYQQSASVDESLLAIDPRNRLLSRGPRVRLSAEVVRDQALAVSNLLTEKLYGPPVYPPNPVKTISNAFKGETKWVEATDEDRYRRSIYTFVKRSSPHPLFDTFDMATREVCSLRRLRTNTPLQSFMTLNDATFLESAGALALDAFTRAVVAETSSANASDNSSKRTRAVIAFAFRQATFTTPSEKQIDSLEQLYEKSLAEYDSYDQATKELIRFAFGPRLRLLDTDGLDSSHHAELASYVVVCNIILNLDSFINN